jgi:LDH2 family malate/lactate/ureidoglycolate dehydrogenase
MTVQPRYGAADLVDFASALLAAAGLDGDKPRRIAGHLVQADLMGHTTHGLALLADYLEEVEGGAMTATGEPAVVRERGACLTWDGRRLPGVWLTSRAVDTALERAADYGTATVVIRNSHHIACLATFLEPATARGRMVLIASSDPSARSVAPHGGTRAVFTPNPIAVGIPTPGDPILIDTSTSVTTNGMSGRLEREGRRFPHPWLLDAAGEPTDDPAVLSAEPPGTILPAGGLDHGHKGYGLALMVEALTQGLGGFGRADEPQGLGCFGVRAGPRPRGLRRSRRLHPPDRPCRGPLPLVAAAARDGGGAAARRRRAQAQARGARAGCRAARRHHGVARPLGPAARRGAAETPGRRRPAVRSPARPRE